MFVVAVYMMQSNSAAVVALAPKLALITPSWNKHTKYKAYALRYEQPRLPKHRQISATASSNNSTKAAPIFFIYLGSLSLSLSPLLIFTMLLVHL